MGHFVHPCPVLSCPILSSSPILIQTTSLALDAPIDHEGQERKKERAKQEKEAPDEEALFLLKATSFIPILSQVHYEEILLWVPLSG